MQYSDRARVVSAPGNTIVSIMPAITTRQIALGNTVRARNRNWLKMPSSGGNRLTDAGHYRRRNIYQYTHSAEQRRSVGKVVGKGLHWLSACKPHHAKVSSEREASLPKVPSKTIRRHTSPESKLPDTAHSAHFLIIFINNYMYIIKNIA